MSGSGARARRVAAHYDELSDYYVDLWGEHIHHGYYERGDERRDEATRKLIDLLLEDLDLTAGASVLDVGCGVGGTARMLTAERGCRVVGVTLSPVQATMARRGTARGLSGDVAEMPRFLVGDAAALPLRGSFDAMLAVEVLSHVEDRAAFFAEAARLLRPGGCLGIAAWLRAEDGGASDSTDIVAAIEEGMLVTLPRASEYDALIAGAGLRRASYRDVSAQVARTWDLCLEIVARPALWSLAVRRGSDTLAFVRSFKAMQRGFASNAFRYALITAVRPA